MLLLPPLSILIVSFISACLNTTLSHIALNYSLQNSTKWTFQEPNIRPTNKAWHSSKPINCWKPEITERLVLGSMNYEKLFVFKKCERCMYFTQSLVFRVFLPAEYRFSAAILKAKRHSLRLSLTLFTPRTISAKFHYIVKYPHQSRA